MTMERQLGPDPILEPHAKAHDYRVKITRTWIVNVTAKDDDEARDKAVEEEINHWNCEQEYEVDDLGETEKDQD